MTDRIAAPAQRRALRAMPKSKYSEGSAALRAFAVWHRDLETLVTLACPEQGERRPDDDVRAAGAARRSADNVPAYESELPRFPR